MTMLTLVQHHLRRTGLPYTTTVYGSTDPQILQVMALLEEEGNDLAMRNDWQALTRECSHTSLAQEDQGAIESFLGTAIGGFRHIKNETFWDRTNNLPIVGPLNDKDWQAIKGMNSTGARYRFRIRSGRLLITPTPTAGLSWYFEYVSNKWIVGADGVTYKQYFTSDTDTLLLPEELLLAGLRWRWMAAKGLDYAELYNTYEMQVKDAIGRDGGKRPVYMDLQTEHTGPAVFVPAGNWAIP
jgi:hypothetical protein